MQMYLPSGWIMIGIIVILFFLIVVWRKVRVL